LLILLIIYDQPFFFHYICLGADIKGLNFYYKKNKNQLKKNKKKN
jgi:hypothetical protein